LMVITSGFLTVRCVVKSSNARAAIGFVLDIYFCLNFF
jgi:hypothetical protein